MLALQELVNLPERDKEALGATAKAGEIAQQPVTWRKTRRIFNQHADRLRKFLEAAAARSLAEKGYKRVCVLGSGALTGVAKDSALKVLEMMAGEVKTMAESVLGLRHGPMSALDTETLLVCFASSDMRRQRYEIDLLRELGVKEIVALRVVVGPAGSADLATCSEQYLMIGEGVPDLYRPPVDVMLGQLLGLSFSLAHGLKPDAPSPHGVISRVVGESRIYEQAA